MYPEVLDLRGNRIAILKDANELKIEMALNTWPILSFSMPITSPQWQYIRNELYVKYEEDLYIIKNGEDRMSSDGTITNTVECPSIASELNTKIVQQLGSAVGPPNFSAEVFHASGTPAYIMGLILQGTGWAIGTISASLQTKVRSFLSEWESVVANLLEVAEKYEGYLRYRPSEKRIDLLDELDIGVNNGVTIEYAKNMTELSRTRDTSELVTRLYVYGGVPPNLGAADQLEMTVNQVGLGIEDPNHPHYRPPLERIYQGGTWTNCTSYIHNFQYFVALGFSLADIVADVTAKGRASSFILEGQFKDDDYIDAARLYDHAKKKLVELSKPIFNYSIGIIDLAKLSGFGQESFNIGDWLTVINRDLGIEVEARIVKYSLYPGFPEKTKLELANSRDTIGDVLANTVKVAGGLQRNSQVHQLKRNMLKTVSMLINSGYNTITLADDTDPSKLVRLSSGGIGVSEDGGQTFPYAMTGEGILGDKLVISDVHVVRVDDGHTRIQSNGVTVFDASPIPVKRVHLGQYAPGQFGLQIHGGALKVTGGGIRDSEIGSVSAEKLIGGTITAEESIFLGDDRFELSAQGRYLSLKETSGEGAQEILRLGRLWANYGLFVFNPDGSLRLAIDRVGLSIIGRNASIVIDEHGLNANFVKRFPNKIMNSGFEQFDPHEEATPEYPGIPRFWTGHGKSTTLENFEGDMSLELRSGESMEQGMYDHNTHAGAYPGLWQWMQTRVSFRHKGEALRVWVRRVSGNAPYTLTDNSGTFHRSGIYLDFPPVANWEDGLRTLSFQPESGDGRVKVCFQNRGGESSYIDAVQMEPDFTGKWPSFYTPGPRSLAQSEVGLTRGIAFYIGGPLVVGTRVSFKVPLDLRVTGVFLEVDEPPQDGGIVIDLLVDDETMYTWNPQYRRPRIEEENNRGVGRLPQIKDLPKESKVTLTIVQVGAAAPGENLSVTVVCEVI